MTLHIGQVLTHPDGVNATEIPVGSTVEYRFGDEQVERCVVELDGQTKLLRNPNPRGPFYLNGDSGTLTILSLPPGYGAAVSPQPDAGEELARAVGRHFTLTPDQYRAMGDSSSAAVATALSAYRDSKGGV